ncbi:MAG: hypothetical protein KBH99_01190 [Syntrophobacteraceae bacterium]|nr:hypothetical protein [Syntrophobacteraceae bacterium]
MIQKELDRHKDNHIRMLILRIASASYPNPVDAQLVRVTLGNLGYPMDEQDLNYYLAFLEERGYIKLMRRSEFSITMVGITADGIDVMDERKKDCSIGFGDR